MKRTITTGLPAIPCLLLLLAQPALGDSEFSYLVGMSVGLREIEFDLSSIGSQTFFILNDGSGPVVPAVPGATLGFDFEETMYTAGFSGTLIYDRINLSAVVELPVQTENTSLHTEIHSLPGLGFPVNDEADRGSELDRFDINLTLGYSVWKGLSIFSGYKYTEFELDSQESNFVLGDKDQNYVEEGFFIGSSYAWQFGTKGSLSLSIAYAYLDAEFSESNVNTEPPPFGFTFGEFNYDGSSNGLSYGARWSGRLVDQWLYTVGLKYQSYSSNNNATTLQSFYGDNFLSQDPNVSVPIQVTPIAVTEIDTEHTDTSLSFGILYMFN